MRRIIFCALSLLLISHVSSATHLRGGHISIKQLGKTSLTCRITITVYTDTESSVTFGGTKLSEGDLLNFGDGSPSLLVPQIGPATTPSGPGFSSTYAVIDLVRKVAMATYTIDHTYSKLGTYVVSYQEPNRNSGIINFDQSLNSQFYLESSFKLDPFSDKVYTSPVFLTNPAFFAPTESSLSYSMAAQDSNDYTLLYELTTPNMGRGENVINYELPESCTINQFNGLITWDTKFIGTYTLGEYTFNAKVHQFENGKSIGYTIRDFQIILEESDFNGTISDNRDLDENNRIFISNGNTFTFKVFAEDSEATSLEAFSELSSQSNSFSFSSYDSTNGTRNIKVGVVSITSSAEVLRDNPYAIVVRGSYQDGKFYKDLGYLFYTKDIEIPGLPPVVATEVEELKMSVYPNPFKDFLKIEGSSEKNKSITILSVSGQVLLEKKNFSEDMIDLKNIPAGVYVLQVQTRSSGCISQRIFRLVKTN